jgi:hypothetical protein
MVVIGVVEPVAGAEKQASQDKDRGEGKQNYFDIHSSLKFSFKAVV